MEILETISFTNSFHEFGSRKSWKLLVKPIISINFGVLKPSNLRSARHLSRKHSKNTGQWGGVYVYYVHVCTHTYIYTCICICICICAMIGARAHGVQHRPCEVQFDDPQSEVASEACAQALRGVLVGVPQPGLLAGLNLLVYICMYIWYVNIDLYMCRQYVCTTATPQVSKVPTVTGIEPLGVAILVTVVVFAASKPPHPRNCRQLLLLACSLRRESTNSHRDQGGPDRGPRNCHRF